MKTIWKFAAAISDELTIVMEESQILCVQFQFGAPRVWAIVDPEKTTIVRRFKWFGTGHPLPEPPPAPPDRIRLPTPPMVYVGTVQLASGELVFHLFEVSP